MAELWNRQRLKATVRTAALCAYVDNHLADEEREKICECIATYAPSEEHAREMIAEARRLPEWTSRPKSGFRAAQFREIKAALKTREEREVAFHLAVQVARVHRGIRAEETSFLLNLMGELEIDGEYAQQLVRQARRPRAKPRRR